MVKAVVAILAGLLAASTPNAVSASTIVRVNNGSFNDLPFVPNSFYVVNQGYATYLVTGTRLPYMFHVDDPRIGGDANFITIFVPGRTFDLRHFDVDCCSVPLDYEDGDGWGRIDAFGANGRTGGWSFGGTDQLVTYHPNWTNLTSVTIRGNHAGIGNFALGAVPEPSTWAMLLLGFGLIGHAARRQKEGRQSFALRAKLS